VHAVGPDTQEVVLLQLAACWYICSSGITAYILLMVLLIHTKECI